MRLTLLSYLLLLAIKTAAFCGLPPNVPFRIIAVRHAEKDLTARAQSLTPGQHLPVFVQGLDTVGFQRAAYLTGYLFGIPENNNTTPSIPAVPPLFADLIAGGTSYHPISLFASLDTNAGGPGTGTWRPLMTVSAAAGVLNPDNALTDVNVYSAPDNLVKQIESDDFSTLADAIKDSSNEDKTIVVSWESKRLPFMLAAVDFSITGYDQDDPNALVNHPMFIQTFGKYPNLIFPGNQSPWGGVDSTIFNMTFVVEYFVDGSVLRPSFTVLEQRTTGDFNNPNSI